MNLKGVRAAVLVEQLYQEMELWYPHYRLKEAGAESLIVGPEAGQTYPSKFGYPAKSDRAASEVSANDFDVLIIPGGYAPDHLRRHKAIVQLTREMLDRGKVVGAICHAGWLLCSAGGLRGRKVTSFSAIKDDMVNAGAEWVDAEVVRDGNLITSRKPDDLPAFMHAIVSAASELKR